MFRAFSIAVGVLCLTFPSTAVSQPLSVVEVFGEYDDDLNGSCQARHDSAVAAVEAALRYNRVEVGKTPVKGYINLMAMSLSETLCVVKVSIEFYANVQAVVPTLGSRFVEAHVCDRGGVLTGSPSGMQSRVNSALRDMTDACVSEIAKDD